MFREISLTGGVKLTLLVASASAAVPHNLNESIILNNYSHFQTIYSNSIVISWGFGASSALTTPATEEKSD